jgi:protein-S-isoprenylcysteine O-methyltransferase Ste14
MKHLVLRTVIGLVEVAIGLALLTFLPAGTFDYWQAWLFMAAFLIPSILTSLWLLRHDRGLLERRLSAGPTAESRPAQRAVMVFMIAVILAMGLIPALDRRFGWSDVPAWLSVLANASVALGFWMTWRVYRENSFTAATVQVAEGQTVISTGPYALVRHPMYVAAVVMLGPASLALGSWWGLPLVPLMLIGLVLRIHDEERLLATELPGYADYRQKVRWRLLPGLY